MKDNMSNIKKICICIAIASMIFLVASMFILFFNNSGNTIFKREKILNSKVKGIHIVSEMVVEDYIICQIKNGSLNGCARFEKINKKYVYKHHLLTSKDIVMDSFLVDGQYYHVLVCDKPNLERVDIVFFNLNSKVIIETRTMELAGNMICVIKAPDEKHYSISATFIDTSGNMFTYK